MWGLPCHTSNSCHGNWMLNCGSTVRLASWNRLFFFVQDSLPHLGTMTHYTIIIMWHCQHWLWNYRFYVLKWYIIQDLDGTFLYIWFPAHQIKDDLCFLYYCITYAVCMLDIILIIHHIRGFQSFRCHGPPNMIILVRQTPILKLKCSYMFSCVKSQFILWKKIYYKCL